MMQTQIQLTEQQADMLKVISNDKSISVEALIRKAIDHYLITQTPDRSALYRQAMTVVGKYKAGVENISVEHDKYLEEAFE